MSKLLTGSINQCICKNTGIERDNCENQPVKHAVKYDDDECGFECFFLANIHFV